MADVYDTTQWHEADDDNTSVFGAGFAEGMRPGSLNNASRAVMGAIKRFVDQQSPKTTSGTSTAFTISYDVAPGSLVAGMTFLVAFDKNCGNAPTLNINSLGAKSLYKFSGGEWVALVAGDLLSGQIVRLAYDSASGALRVLQPLNVVPAGTTLGFRGTSDNIPAGWLIEDGKSVGDADSGATALASAAAEALFKVLWPNSNYSVQDSSGSASTKGSTADGDWTAHKRLVLVNFEGSYRAGNNTSGGASGGSTSLLSGIAAVAAKTVSVFGTFSGTTGQSGDFRGKTDGGTASSNNTHTHNFSGSVTSTGTVPGQSATVTGTVTPPYITEISIIKL